MNTLDQQIKQLQSQVTRQIQLEDQMIQWRNELRKLKLKVEQLRRIRDIEQSDVDKLENGGLGTMVHKLLGTMDEKMDKERQEAQDATDNYTTALHELQSLEQSIASGEAELEKLQDCQTQYLQVMEQKIKRLEELTNAEQAEEASAVLTNLIRYEKRRRTLRESMIYSQLGLSACSKNLKALAAAKYWSQQDAPIDEYLTIAEVQAGKITDQITNLQAKLAQMGIDPQEHLHVGDYLRTPKLYITGLSEEFSLPEQISKAIAQVEHVQDQVQNMAEKMELALAQIEELIFKNQAIYEDMTA